MKPIWNKGLTAALTTFALLTASSALALEIKSATAAGTACKADQGIKATATNQVLTIDFPQMNTESSEGKRLGRSNCTASINLTATGERRFRPARVLLSPDVIKGNADDLSLRFNAWFQGSKDTGAAELKLHPSSGSSKTLEILPQVWSPCAKEITLNSGVALVAKSKTGLSKDVSATFKEGVKIELEWEPCSK